MANQFNRLIEAGITHSIKCCSVNAAIDHYVHLIKENDYISISSNCGCCCTLNNWFVKDTNSIYLYLWFFFRVKVIIKIVNNCIIKLIFWVNKFLGKLEMQYLFFVKCNRFTGWKEPGKILNVGVKLLIIKCCKFN